MVSSSWLDVIAGIGVTVFEVTLSVISRLCFTLALHVISDHMQS
jgi:hypothetical protein